MIAVALQVYGAYISDTGGSLAAYAVNDLNTSNGNVTWASVGMTQGPSLNWLPWSQMRVITIKSCN
jgi:hypothetical protein